MVFLVGRDLKMKEISSAVNGEEFAGVRTTVVVAGSGEPVKKCNGFSIGP